jgi:hypothetical protein
VEGYYCTRPKESSMQQGSMRLKIERKNKREEIKEKRTGGR